MLPSCNLFLVIHRWPSMNESKIKWKQAHVCFRKQQQFRHTHFCMGYVADNFRHHLIDLNSPQRALVGIEFTWSILWVLWIIFYPIKFRVRGMCSTTKTSFVQLLWHHLFCDKEAIVLWQILAGNSKFWIWKKLSIAVAQMATGSFQRADRICQAVCTNHFLSRYPYERTWKLSSWQNYFVNKIQTRVSMVLSASRLRSNRWIGSHNYCFDIGVV